MLTLITIPVVITLLFIYYQKQLTTHRLKLSNEKLSYQKDLVNSIIESQESERRRIGQDLHDDVGTSLSNLRLIIYQIGKGSEPVEFYCRESNAIIDKVIDDVRNISHNLLPANLSLYGVAGAIHELCELINKCGNVNIIIRNDAPFLLSNLNDKIALCLYRVFEELLTNTIRHAGASNAWINFAENEGQLTIHYGDDGKGMDITQSKKKGIGMRNIESRLEYLNAVYTIVSSPQVGFNIKIQIKS